MFYLFILLIHYIIIFVIESVLLINRSEFIFSVFCAQIVSKVLKVMKHNIIFLKYYVSYGNTAYNYIINLYESYILLSIRCLSFLNLFDVLKMIFNVLLMTEHFHLFFLIN